MEKVRFGIISIGTISQKFACAVKMLSDATLSAVYSRSLEKASEFSRKFDVPQYFNDLEAFLHSDVDIVYVASPHSHHFSFARQCLLHGKGVICEKAFTANAEQARELAALAQRNHLFLLEGMWSRFRPYRHKIEKWITDGRIGEIRRIHCTFSFDNSRYPREGRMHNPALAGGALLDLGIYGLSFICSFLGTKPEKITSDAFLGETGVDENCCAVLRYPSGAMGILNTSMMVFAPSHASLYGTLGRIEIPHFESARTATLYFGRDEVAEEANCPYENGFQFEIKAAMESFRAGETESKQMPLQETIEILECCDQMRAQWGLRYPFEETMKGVL